jgi:hypothetical protein
MRRIVSLIMLAVIAPALLAQNQPAAATDTTPRRTVQFSGMVLVNGFFTNARTNNSDVPQLAEQDSLGVAGSGGTIRQTRLGVFVTDPDVLGGTFTGEVDTDFFGGQLPSSGGRTFPLLRIRRAIGTLQWSHMQLLFGQESPLVAERSPRSLASVGFPDFAGAGNLWLWIPQARVSFQTGYSLRLGLQGAVLAPVSGAPQSTFATQPDSAERSKRPSLQGRVRLGWGPADDPSEIAVGGHIGWLRSDSVGGDSLIDSRAITIDARISLGFLELIGEVYNGQGLAGLGGGGIGQNFAAGGDALRSQGGWAQINIRPRRAIMFGVGCGADDPDDRDVPLGGRLQNLACEGHLEWRPPGPLLFGFEFRRFSTRYRTGDARASHLNLAVGYRF